MEEKPLDVVSPFLLVKIFENKNDINTNVKIYLSGMNFSGSGQRFES